MMAGDPPQPRLCHIRKVDNFDGYGFNLHAEKNKPGQFVGKIDEGSPAEKAGLKEGDRIVEVNGANVNQENHKQVVTRIKSIQNETTLLVVDKTCEEYHRQHGVIVKSSLSYVKICSNSDTEQENIYNDNNDNTEDETIDTRLQQVTIEDCNDEDSNRSATPINVEESQKIVRDSSFSSNKYSDRTSVKSETRRSSRSSMSTSTPSSSPSPSSSGSPSPPLSEDKFSSLDLPGTAAEMKLRISAKKKKDPRKDNRMDFTRKHQIIQSL